MAEIETPQKSTRVRSPAYPSLGLPDAIVRARTLYEKEAQGRVPIAAEVIARDWEYASLNGSALTTISALKQFDLLNELEVGDGKPRQLKLTPGALCLVVRKSDDPDWLKAARAAALRPKLYDRLWKKYGWPLPSIESVRHYLELDEGYNTKFINGIISDYKATIGLAKLGDGDKISDTGAGESEDGRPSLAVGDFVQWESQGVAQFAKPRRVKGQSEDGNWLFVEGSETGIAKKEAKKVDPPSRILDSMISPPINQSPTPPPNPFYTGGKDEAGTKQYTLTVDTGNVVLMWPDKLTAEDFQTIDGWLDGMKKKVQRSVKADQPDSAQG